MFFHAGSSTKEFYVSTEVLQNKSLATNLENYFSFHLIGDRGEKTQATASYFDKKTKVLFMTQVNKNGIGCWNTKGPLRPDTFYLLVSDSKKLVFPNYFAVSIDKYTQNSNKVQLKFPLRYTLLVNVSWL